MTSEPSVKRKLVIFFSEPIGLILSFIPTIWIISQGGNIEDTFIDIAFTTLKLALLLRSIHLVFIISSIALILFLFLSFIHMFRRTQIKTIDFTTNKWFILRVFFGIYIGYILGKILFYWILNAIFYRNVFVTIPFFLGISLLIGVLGIISGNLEFTPNFINFLSKSTGIQQFRVSKLRLLDSLGKIILFGILSLLLIVPNVFPLLGFLPTPPSEPDEPYLASDDLFDVQVIKLEHLLPTNISAIIEPENPDGRWYTYIYLPTVKMESNIQFPVALYLHGFTGIDIDLYDSSMKALAERGVISIFTQYATTINLQGVDEDIQFDHPAGNPELYIRYAMEWSGITQAVAALILEDETIGSQTLLDNLGPNYVIDFSRLIIIGHSMGGGMVPYIATKSLEQGWASNELILDMEAPWYESTWKGYEPDYKAFPKHTLLNVVTYEDDHAVSQCIGIDFYEKIRASNGTALPDEQLNFIYLRSDFYGFPRLLASHYVPTDPLDDPLHQFGYKKRIKAMAYYLFGSAQGAISQINEAYEYFLGSEVSDMGQWSDGKAVNEAYTTNDPYGIRGSSSLVDQLQDRSNDLCVESSNQ